MDALFFYKIWWVFFVFIALLRTVASLVQFLILWFFFLGVTYSCYAVSTLLAAVRPSLATACSRILYFMILPAAFMGNSLTKSI